jgi:DNA-directed RNA polymerase specialized sigma24 family protein
VTDGHPPGRPLTELELRYGLLLIELRDSANRWASQLTDKLQDLVLELTEDGASTQGIGDALGFSKGSAQNYKDRAKQRRGKG